MFARGLDIGQMSATISGRHLADIDSMSGRCLKTIEAQCRPDIGKCRPQHRPDVGNYIWPTSANVSWLISGRLNVCTWARCRPDVVNDIRPTSGQYRLDVGPMSETRRLGVGPTSGNVGATSGNVGRDSSLMSEIMSGRHRQISGRLHVCTWVRCRPDIRPILTRCRADI